jgi:hypothetical protein
MDEKKIEKLKSLFQAVNDSLTKEDFINSFKLVTDLIKKVQDKNKEEINALKDLANQLADELKSDNKTDLEDAKQEINNLLSSALKEQENGMNFIRDKVRQIKSGIDGKDGKNGKNGLNGKDGQDGKDGSSDTPEETRDKLETLKDDERLDKSAIKGLQEILDELKNRKVGGGGFSYMAMDIHIIDGDVPTGDINGVNKDFVIKHKPNPIASLKVYKDGQRMKLTTDYTFSGQTISFVDAPLTDALIICDYRI